MYMYMYTYKDLRHTKSGLKEATLDCPPSLPSGNTSTTTMPPASLVVKAQLQLLGVPSGKLHDMLGCPLQIPQVGRVQVSPAADKKTQIETHDHL